MKTRTPPRIYGQRYHRETENRECAKYILMETTNNTSVPKIYSKHKLLGKSQISHRKVGKRYKTGKRGEPEQTQERTLKVTRSRGSANQSNKEVLLHPWDHRKKVQKHVVGRGLWCIAGGNAKSSGLLGSTGVTAVKMKLESAPGRVQDSGNRVGQSICNFREICFLLLIFKVL